MYAFSKHQGLLYSTCLQLLPRLHIEGSVCRSRSARTDTDERKSKIRQDMTNYESRTSPCFIVKRRTKMRKCLYYFNVCPSTFGTKYCSIYNHLRAPLDKLLQLFNPVRDFFYLSHEGNERRFSWPPHSLCHYRCFFNSIFTGKDFADCQSKCTMAVKKNLTNLAFRCNFAHLSSTEVATKHRGYSLSCDWDIRAGPTETKWTLPSWPYRH